MITGHLVLRNASEAQLQLRLADGPPQIGFLCRPGSILACGTYDGGVYGTGNRLDMPPGVTARVALLCGTARGDNKPPSAFEVGRYEVVVAPEILIGFKNGGPQTRQVARSHPIEVIPAPNS